MEWIDPKTGIRSEEEIMKANKILSSLSLIGEDSSLYDSKLVNLVTKDDLYILTSNGKVYPGGSVKCKQTKQKDKIEKNTIKPVLNEDSNTLQFIAFFKDGTMIDARGHYARNNLKMIRRGKRG